MVAKALSGQAKGNPAARVLPYAVKPGEVRNPQGINGLVMLARHLKSLGLVDQCATVIQQCLIDEDSSVRLAACALALRYMFGVPHVEIVDGKKEKSFDWATLTDEQRKFLLAIREALVARSSSGDSPDVASGGGIHAGSAGSGASQSQSR